MNPVLKSVKPVIEESKEVRINRNNLIKFCHKFQTREFKFWLNELPFDFPKLTKKEELNFLFILDSLQFCFWGSPKWTVEYKGEFYDGSWGLLASLVRAIEKGFEILNLKYLVRIPEKDLRGIFSGNTEIPLFKERLKILRENSKILIEKFNGNFENLIKTEKEDALKILNLITNNFPSFNDSAIYKEHKVFFHKKAQLLIAEISKRKLAKIKNIDKLTALADYKIPLVLKELGILKYSQNLTKKINNKIQIPVGSEEEIEIRANNIWAIELMKNELKSKFPKINALDIDFHLWMLGQNESFKGKPYHLTRTIFY